MKRSIWIPLALAVVLGSAPMTYATVNGTFVAQKVSTVTVGTWNGGIGTGTGGLVEMNNTGFVVSDLANSYFFQDTGAAQPVTSWNSMPAIQHAIIAGQNQPTNNWLGTQGFTGVNAQLNTTSGSNGAQYSVGMAYADELFPALDGGSGTANFGGVALANADSGAMLLRETYNGDVNMDGLVNAADFQKWQLNFVTPTTIDWAHGDVNYDGLINAADFQSWQLQFVKNSAQLGAAPSVPEPGTFVLLLVAAFGLVFSKFFRSKGMMMKKVAVVLALSVLLLAAGTARAELLSYDLYVDGVYADLAHYNTVSPLPSTAYTMSADHKTVTLVQGTTTAFLDMAVVATIYNGGSASPVAGPIDGDGIYAAFLNFIGTQSTGTGTLTPGLNTGSMGNAAGNPGMNNPGAVATPYWVNNWGTPVQAFKATTKGAVITEWPENFTGNNSQSGTVSGGGLIVGKNGPYQASDFGGAHGANGAAYIAAFAAPSPAGNQVTYNNDGTVATVTANPAVAVPSAGFLLGATGPSLTKAQFILGELTYAIGSLTNGATAGVTASPADFNATNLSYSTLFDYQGTQVTSKGPDANVVAGTPVSISVTSSVVTATPSYADISAVTPSVATVLANGSVTLSTSITNTSHVPATQENLTKWTLTGTAPVAGVINTNTATVNVAVGSSTAASTTYLAPQQGNINGTFFGNVGLTLNSSGSGATLPSNVTTGSASTNVNVVGIGKTGAADGNATGVYGPTTLTSSTVANGGSLANLETTVSTLTTSGTGIGQTYAQIVEGTNSTGGNVNVTENWRNRKAGERPASLSGSNLPVLSDVVALNGTGTSNVYVLQMSYDPAQALIAGHGSIFIGESVSNASNWGNAVDSNTGNVAPAGDQGVKQSWSTFRGLNGGSLATLLGAWGWDSATDTAWAVLNQSGGKDFAVVPEPGTLALLLAGALALGVSYRRRKSAKA